MSGVQPDLGALYALHGDAMHKVAASVLRPAGRHHEAADAVHDAIVSIMASPPKDVRNWEAFLVSAAKRRALDRLGSAAVRRAGSALPSTIDDVADDVDIEQDVVEYIERARRAGIAWDSLSLLDDRTRKAVWEYIALERPRAEVAAELGVSPSRVSQMVKQALALLQAEVTRREGNGNE